jgi:hypothetical protein
MDKGKAKALGKKEEIPATGVPSKPASKEHLPW